MHLFLPFFQTYSVCHIVIYWHWNGMNLLLDCSSHSWCLVHRTSFQTFDASKVFVSQAILDALSLTPVHYPRIARARMCTCVHVHVCVCDGCPAEVPGSVEICTSHRFTWFTQNLPLTSPHVPYLMRSLPWFNWKDPQLNTVANGAANCFDF